LHLAAREGHISCVEELLKRGSYLNAKTVDDCTALDLAVLSQHSEVTMRLIEIGADMNYKRSLMTWTKVSFRTDATIFGQLMGTSVVSFRDSLYLIGGIDKQSSKFSSDIYILQILENNEKKNGSSHFIVQCNRLSTSGERIVRFRHAAVVRYHEVFLFGGYSNLHEMAEFSILPMLDLTTLRWSTRQTKGDFPPPMIDCSASLLDSEVYVFGGKGDTVYNALYGLDLDTLYWRKIECHVQHCTPLLPSLKLQAETNNQTIGYCEPSPRCEHSAFFVGKQLFVLSGNSPIFSPPQIEIFDTESLMWQIPSQKSENNSPLPHECKIVWASLIKQNRVLCLTNSKANEVWTFEYDKNKNEIVWDCPKVIGQTTQRHSGYYGNKIDTNKVLVFGERPMIDSDCIMNMLVTEEKKFSLESDLRKIVNSEEFADVELLVANSNGTVTTFYAHKIILSTQSSYFDSLFQQLEASNKKEIVSTTSAKSRLRIVINDVHSKVMPLLLEFIYTDSVQSPPSLAVDLTRSVKKYVPNRYTRLIRQVMRDVGDGDSHYKLLQEQIGSLFNNTKYSDVSFVLETGQTIFAHKAIISARSEHFRALFNGGFDESREEQIFIRHVKSEIFLKMMRFLYSKPVEITPETAVDLLIAADIYHLPELFALCEISLMESDIDADNVLGMFQLADMSNATQLKSYCLSYILTNYDICTKNIDFMRLHISQKEELFNCRRKKNERVVQDKSKKQQNDVLINFCRKHSKTPLLEQHFDEKYTKTLSGIYLKTSLSRTPIALQYDQSSTNGNNTDHAKEVFLSQSSGMKVDDYQTSQEDLRLRQSDTILFKDNTFSVCSKNSEQSKSRPKVFKRLQDCHFLSENRTNTSKHKKTAKEQAFVVAIVATIFIFGAGAVFWQRFLKTSK